MRIMPPANLPPRSSRAAAAHGRRGQRRRRRICACCFKVITKPDSRAQPESSFLPCRIPTRLRRDSCASAVGLPAAATRDRPTAKSDMNIKLIKVEPR